jgi:hypothetical protein
MDRGWIDHGRDVKQARQLRGELSILSRPSRSVTVTVSQSCFTFFSFKKSLFYSKAGFLAPSPPFFCYSLQRVKRRRRQLPAAISPASFLSGHQFGTGRGGWLGNRRADVYTLGLSPRSRVCSLSVDGGAMVCRRGGAPLRLVFLGVVGVAGVVTASWNKSSRPLPRSGGVFLRR